MKNKLKSLIKKFWRLFLFPGIVSIAITILLVDYYLSTQTGIAVSIVAAIFVGIICYIALFLIMAAYYAVKAGISMVASKLPARTQKVLPETTPAPKTEQADLDNRNPLTDNNGITEKQITSTRAPIYKVSITYDRELSDTERECLIEKSPFVQPNAKRLKAIKSYIVVDTETTGLSYKRDKIIEISLARYANGEQTDHYTTLINPRRHIPEEATAINHIEDEDVADAPTFAMAWPQISQFFDGAVIVGHNVKFDLNMIGYNMPRKAKPLDVTYLDTVQLAKDAFPGQPNYKLETLVESLGISDNQEHRAESDVDLTARLFEMCRTTIITRYEKELTERREQKAKEKAERQAAYGWSPLLDQNFVFTGEFQHDRGELQNALQSVGANLRGEINTKTRYLVYGNLKNLPQWALERKYKKAQKMIADGAQIKVLSEEEYLNLLKAMLEQAPTQ